MFLYPFSCLWYVQGMTDCWSPIPLHAYHMHRAWMITGMLSLYMLIVCAGHGWLLVPYPFTYFLYAQGMNDCWSPIHLHAFYLYRAWMVSCPLSLYIFLFSFVSSAELFKKADSVNWRLSSVCFKTICFSLFFTSNFPFWGILSSAAPKLLSCNNVLPFDSHN